VPAIFEKYKITAPKWIVPLIGALSLIAVTEFAKVPFHANDAPRDDSRKILVSAPRLTKGPVKIGKYPTFVPKREWPGIPPVISKSDTYTSIYFDGTFVTHDISLLFEKPDDDCKAKVELTVAWNSRVNINSDKVIVTLDESGAEPILSIENQEKSANGFGLTVTSPTRKFPMPPSPAILGSTVPLVEVHEFAFRESEEVSKYHNRRGPYYGYR